MAEEFFDVVNAQDEVVGRLPRAEVHRQGLLHRAAHILVRNSRGEVFLQRRSQNKDRQPGLWDTSASGHVDSGEEYDDAAIRELGEELGFRPSRRPRRMFKLDAGAETDQEHVWVYEVQSEGPFVLNPEEIDGGGWFAPEEITRWSRERPEEFVCAFRIIWARILAQGWGKGS